MLIRSFHFPAEKLLPDIPLILTEMGYNPPLADHFLAELIDEILRAIPKHTNARAGFILMPDDIITIKNTILMNNLELFNPGRIIIDQLQNVTTLALFIATLGNKFDQYVSLNKQIDLLKAYIIDTIGSLMVEKAVDLLEQQISDLALTRKVKCSNRFSPGYCQWDVEEQLQLFDLLPAEYNWVTLQPSCLMTPLKSVSGIIGLGKNVIKKEYQCPICQMTTCFRYKKFLKGE
ncbi:MAG: vitamin B12 dependent-methionine synthase activation domain-containing protein [Candidatus Stygibacter australis]|nr:vitamin B12 dependent-methionine synthase activation domain-containing protein [Candidatus Stygibacter australis]